MQCGIMEYYMQITERFQLSILLLSLTLKFLWTMRIIWSTHFQIQNNLHFSRVKYLKFICDMHLDDIHNTSFPPKLFKKSQVLLVKILCNIYYNILCAYTVTYFIFLSHENFLHHFKIYFRFFHFLFFI